MSLDNKKFRNNKTGEVVKVISTFENIAVLENKQKTTVGELMNPSIFTEEIDPSSFFSNQSAYNILAEKIKTIPTHMIQDEENSTSVNVNQNYNTSQFAPTMNESAVVMTTEDDERAELARKYGISEDTTQSLQRQNEAFARILGDDSEEELPQIPVRQFDDSQIQRVEVKREEMGQVQRPQVQPQPSVQVEDPIITMFKRTKRSVDFKVNVDVSDKIPRLDFIEMMEDSYEISIIDYLADEFTDKILKDPSIIRESIKSKIKHLVYGAPTALSNTEEKKENMENTKNFPTPVNPQITDSVTQVKDQITDAVTQKPKTTRKLRTKKDTTK